MLDRQTDRNSSIELLRIIAALFVITLHYIQSNSDFLIGSSGANYYLGTFLMSISICAVNIFVLITGYFSCFSKKAGLMKLLALFVQMKVIDIVFSNTLSLVNSSFSVKSLVLSLLPCNWFFIVYIALIILSPFINRLFSHLSNCQLIAFTVVLFVAFSCWESVIEYLGYYIDVHSMSMISNVGGAGGYSTVNFVLMYSIGAVLRRFENKHFRFSAIVGCYLANIFIIFAHSFVSLNLIYIAWEYSNIFVISLSVLSFLFFKNLHIKTNIVINFVAKASFVVYLTHGYFLSITPFPKLYCRTIWEILICLGIHLLSIYLLGFIIYVIYQYSFGKLVSYIFMSVKSKIGSIKRSPIVNVFGSFYRL